MKSSKCLFIKRIILLSFLFLLVCVPSFGQSVRGAVTDAVSGKPIEFADVIVKEKSVGTVTDSSGRFEISNLPVGRYTIVASIIGYIPVEIPEVLIGSKKDVVLNFQLSENVTTLKNVVVRPHITKEQPLNKLSLAGGRMLCVEEASRYAGGFDDPSRLASSFAGVSGNPSGNGICVHGNAPQLLQWRLEGVEIFTPDHFADSFGVGGGAISALSANVLGNSDFFSGAFTSEYGNALSGLFDLKMRNGNSAKFENTVQVGTLGIDLASEGPLNKKTNASYLFNYRYSMTALARQMGILKLDGEAADYQDLNFKFNFPTRKAGTFSLFGVGLIDKSWCDIDNPDKWETLYDANNEKVHQNMLTAGANHKISFKNGGTWHTAIAGAYLKNNINEEYYTAVGDKKSDEPFIFSTMHQKNYQLTFTTDYTQKFSRHFLSKAGVTYVHHFYKLDMKRAENIGGTLMPVYNVDDKTGQLSAYISNSWDISDKFVCNFGVNMEMFSLSKSWSVEPRIAFQWRPTQNSSISFAYGLHSKTERMDVYFVTDEDGNYVNKNLKLGKAHHFLLSYMGKISDNLTFKVEAYYQHLFDIPVEANSSYSILNRFDYYESKALVNKGKGRNYGLDLSLERYFSNGYYYMANGSLYKSEYTGGDGVWHDTRWDGGYMIKLLGGKEWMMGKAKRNVLSVNAKLSYQGGMRHAPVLLDETVQNYENGNPDVAYDETKAFSKSFSPVFMIDLTISYKLNRKKVSHEFALKAINLFQTTVPFIQVYNAKKQKVENYEYGLAIPNLCYRINF